MVEPARPVTTPRARVRPTDPRPLAALLLTVVACALVLLFFNDPAATPGVFPPCFWYVSTGTACPGCGITRALHHLVNGRIGTAFGFNAIGLIVLLSAAAVLIRPFWIALRENRWEIPVFTRRFAWGLLGVGLLWALVRNLPWEPFTLLAP